MNQIFGLGTNCGGSVRDPGTCESVTIGKSNTSFL